MVQLFADGADFNGIVEASKNEKITGFTTNPTLMRQAGVDNYTEFAHKVLTFLSENRPKTSISLEVFADDFDEMYTQAKTISQWGKDHNYSVFVKIPITNTKKHTSYDLIKSLSKDNVQLNITAIFTQEQVENVLDNVNTETENIVSVFAGRIADAGVDPVPVMEDVVFACRHFFNVKTLWASPREVLNFIQADQVGCDIITMTPDLIKKLGNIGKNLNQYSLETVQMFYNDAIKSGYKI